MTTSRNVDAKDSADFDADVEKALIACALEDLRTGRQLGIQISTAVSGFYLLALGWLVSEERLLVLLEPSEVRTKIVATVFMLTILSCLGILVRWLQARRLAELTLQLRPEDTWLARHIHARRLDAPTVIVICLLFLTLGSVNAWTIWTLPEQAARVEAHA